MYSGIQADCGAGLPHVWFVTIKGENVKEGTPNDFASMRICTAVGLCTLDCTYKLKAVYEPTERQSFGTRLLCFLIV